MEESDLLSRASGLFIKNGYERLKDISITVIGAGAIGSWMLIGLAKIGCKNVTFIDFDTVEIVNYSNQIYGPKDIGKTKIEALKGWSESYLPITENYVFLNTKVDERYTLDSEIVISAVDCIEVRKMIFSNLGPNVKLFLDGRIGRSIAAMYSILNSEPVERQYYMEKEIFPKGESAEIPCTEKTFIAPCVFISSYMISSIRNYVNDGMNKFPLKIYTDLNVFIPMILKRDHSLLLKAMQ